jgi:hypothetical protein
MQRTPKILCALSLLLLAGCTDNIEKMKLNQEEKARILALQNPFGSNLIRLSAQAEGRPVLIGLQDCKVYRAETESGVVTEWVRVPEVDGSYPLPSSCSGEHLQFDGEYAIVKFCKTPVGAGGGCAGGIDPHRSRNGKDWEVFLGKGGWTPVGKRS